MTRTNRPRVRVLFALPLFACLASFANCSSSTLPGTTLGTYAVVGTSTTNTCGTGLGAPNPWDYSVQISKDTTLLYWSWLDGSSPASGALTSTSATISGTTSSNVDATDAGSGPCTMQRVDTWTVNLSDTTTSPASFTGTFSYAFSVAAGANCSDQLAAAGGQYDVLPCAVSYTLAANRK